MTDARLLIAGLIVGALMLLALAAVLILRDSAEQDLEARVLAATRGRPTPEVERDREEGAGSPRSWLHWIGETVRGQTKFYSERDILVLEGMIAGGGMDPARVLPVVLGLKAVLMIAVPAIAFIYAHFAGFSGSSQFIALCVAIPLGMLGPDWVIRAFRRPYLAALRRGIPDALDLLVVCSEAGMALETALEHVSREMRHSNPAIAVALAKLLSDILVLPDRREAFGKFSERTGVEGARRLATMLGQSMQYGTPLSQVLRSIAVDLRRERSLALETKAARLPVLLVLPLILFIMPSMIVVLAGPSLMRLTDTLHAVIEGKPPPQ